ncbi:hypothetical protein MUP00_06850 [Candidatus Bathyarchaeota archaeon]|nr:hypothetical protein [Candidatus Bathyarchaeota archaeon]
MTGVDVIAEEGSSRQHGAYSRFWECQNCGFSNPLSVRRKMVRAVFLCTNCGEQVYVFSKTGDSTYKVFRQPIEAAAK